MAQESIPRRDDEATSPLKKVKRGFAHAQTGMTPRPAAAAVLRHTERSGRLLHALSHSARGS